MMPDLWQLVVTQAWQIAVLTILVALLSRTVLRHHAHFAHALWLLVLIKCVTPPVWGNSLGLFSRLQAIVSVEAVVSQQLTVSSGSSERTYSDNVDELNPGRDLTAANVADGDAVGVEVARSDPGELLPRSNEQPEAFSSGSHDVASRRSAVSLPFVLLMTALVGGCMTFCVMVLRYLRCRRLISRGRTTDWDNMLNETLRLLAKQLGIRRIPQVVVSEVQFGPAVLGLFRHTIVLPKCLLSVRNTCAGESMQKTTSSMAGSQSRSCLPGRTATKGGPAIPSATLDLNPRDAVDVAQLAAGREVPPGRRDVPAAGSDSRSCLPGRTAAAGGPAIPSATSDLNPRDAVDVAQLAASREVPPGRRDVPTADGPSADGTESFTVLPEFLTPILAHELLHLRRGDLLTGVLQAVAQCFWWFHPAVWYINRWLSREAERCCDEQVIAELGCSPAAYARSLLSVIESKHQLYPVPVFPGMKPVEITSQRMERIMSLKNGLKKRTPVTCWLGMAVLAVIILPGAASSVESGNQKPTIGEESSPSTQSDIDREPNVVLNDSERQKQQSVPLDSEKKIITRAYIVSDLVLPAAENAEKLDCAPIVELIRTTVAPESWSKDNGEIRVDQNTCSLMIRHSRESHDEIARLLQAIRKYQTAVRLECRLLNLPDEYSFQLIQNRCALQPRGTRGSWALLTRASAEAMLHSLNEHGCEVLFVSTIMTTSGLYASVRTESTIPRFSMFVTPYPVPESEVIRLKYSVQLDGINNMPLETSEFSWIGSLVGSGQTLLLLIEEPTDSKASSAVKRFVVMLTPSVVPEETETLSSPGSEESSSSSDLLGPQ